MNALFGAGAGDAWILDTISNTSGNVAQVKTLLIIGLIGLAVNIVLSSTLLLIKLTDNYRHKHERKSLNDLFSILRQLLSLVKGYEHLERVHKETTKQALAQVQEGVQTISNAVNETTQAAKEAVKTDKERLEQLGKLEQVLKKRVEKSENPVSDDSGSPEAASVPR